MQLAAQQVEVVRRRGAVRHDPVIAATHGQEPFQTGRRVFGPLAFVAVRHQANEAGHAQPFAFARADELVEHDLRAVGKIAELRFPQGQRVGLSQRVAVFKAQYRVFRQHGVDDFVFCLTFADVVQRVIAVFVFLIDQGRVTLRERATGGVLSGQTHLVPFGQQGPKGQRLGSRPVKAFAGLEHLGLGVQQARDSFVQREPVGRGGQRLADIGHGFGRDGCLAALIFLFFRLIEVRPLAIQPVGLVGAVFFAGLEFGVHLFLEGGLHILDLALGDQAVLDQPLGIERQRGLLLLDLLVHHRVGEHRLVAFVVTKAAVADQVDDHVFLELLAEFRRHAGRVHDRFGIVAVDVENRCLDHQSVVGGVGAGATEMRRGGKADLVVHHDMHGPAGAVTAQTRQRETFGDNTLTGKRGIAVQQYGKNGGAFLVVQLVLLGANLAQNNGVHGLKVRRVGGQRQVDSVAVEFTVRRRAKVIFHIAGPVDIIGFKAATLKFVKDRAIGFLHDVCQHGQTAAVRHTDDNVLNAQLTTALDDLFHRGDQAFAPIKAKALGTHVLDVQEFLEAFGLYQLVQDGFSAITGELDFLAVALDPLFQPRGLFGIRDVHVLQREGAAVGAFDDIDDLFHRRDLKAKHVVDKDRAIHVLGPEAIGGRVQFRVGVAVAHAKRIKVCGQVATDTVGADQHQRADTVEHGTLHLRIRQFDPLGRRFFSNLLTGSFCFGRDGPLTGQRRCQVVLWHGRPVAACPGRASGLGLHVGVVVIHRFEECLPCAINRIGVVCIAGIHCL